MLCLGMHSNVMLRFIVQAFQDPLLCSITLQQWPSPTVFEFTLNASNICTCTYAGMLCICPYLAGVYIGPRGETEKGRCALLKY